jgi:hypothetical protein
LVEKTGNREKEAIVVAPCARQKLVFNIYGPEPGGGGGGEVVEVNYGERTVTISKKLLRFLTGRKTKLAEFLAGGLFKTES